MLSNFQNARPEMLKFSDANTTMILSIFYVFIQWLRRVSISLFFDRPEMLSSFEKGRPEMLVTGDAYHWGMGTKVKERNGSSITAANSKRMGFKLRPSTEPGRAKLSGNGS